MKYATLSLLVGFAIGGSFIAGFCVGNAQTDPDSGVAPVTYYNSGYTYSSEYDYLLEGDKEE